MVNRKKLAKAIIELRNKKGYSQRKLAMISGVSNSTISRIESASSDADPETLKKLAPCLDISYEELMKVAGYMKEYSNITKETLKDENFKKLLPIILDSLNDIIPEFNITFENLDDDLKVELFNSVVSKVKYIDDFKNNKQIMTDLIDINSKDNSDVKNPYAKVDEFLIELKEEMEKQGLEFDETSPQELIETYKLLKEFKKRTKGD